MADNEFSIKSDSPVAADLMFWRIVGHEALSRPSAYELSVLSKNQQIDAKDILGRAFDVVIEFFDADGGKHERHCQGHAVRFVRLAQVGRYFEYRILLRSWFWLLEKRRNSRIQQDKPVLDVIDAVFEDSPIKRFKKTKTDHVIGTHDPRRYCVQHQESDYRFVSRLLEDEGIYYWFDAHDAPGTMLMSDASDVAHDKLPVTGTLRYVDAAASEGRFNEITRWVSARRFETGKHASRDSDFKGIRKNLMAQIDSADNHELADFENFEFPGGYFDPDHAETSTKIRGDELTARRDRHWALTTWPDVTAGRAFTLEGDPDGMRDGDYVIGACTFSAVHPGYESLSIPPQPMARTFADLLADDAVNAEALPMLLELIEQTPALAASVQGSCAFLITALPMELSFKPPRLTPPVQMPGPQSAIVVGPAGDELHVDEHGRVKVHFHWDRYDESNEKSTCWVRVSQPWAGKGWGGYFIPRIGQEVIVDFLNGDPDRPIIVGRMYNDEQQIPYKSPTQSGFKTRSTPGGNTSNYNEIQFEDKKGEESLNIHAERNMSTSVELDDSQSVGRDQSQTIKRDQTQRIERNRTVFVTVDDRSVVDGKQTQTVGKDHVHHVVGSQTANVDVNHSLTIGGTSKVDVTGNRTDITRASETRNVTGNQTVTVGGNINFKATNIKFEAAHYDFIVTGANSTVVTSPDSPYAILANGVKIVSNTNVDTSTVGDINDVSIGSNQTVLGSNSSGYIGSSSEANMGLARSTFMGLSLENAISLSMSNFLGVQIESTAAVKLENVAAVGIENKAGEMHCSGLFSVAPGAAAAAGAGTTAAGLGASIAGAAASAISIVSGVVFAIKDGIATYDQYVAAAAQLRDAAGEARRANLTVLADRLNRLAGVADNRATEIGATMGHNIVPGLGTLGVILTEMTGDDGLTGGNRLDRLKGENPDSAGPGLPPPSTGGGDGGSGGGSGDGGGTGGGT